MLGDIKRLPHATVRLGTPDASGVHVGSLERSDHAVPGQLVELPPFDPRGIVGQVGVGAGVATEALPLPEYANHTTNRGGHKSGAFRKTCRFHPHDASKGSARSPHTPSLSSATIFPPSLFAP